jgi:hypothetical protein
MRRLLALFVVAGLVGAGCGPATTSSKKADPPKVPEKAPEIKVPDKPADKPAEKKPDDK